jgi:hypothetical protein
VPPGCTPADRWIQRTASQYHLFVDAQPCFVATSFSRSKAQEFRSMAQQKGFQSVMWEVHVDPAGEHDVSKRCKHVVRGWRDLSCQPSPPNEKNT